MPVSTGKRFNTLARLTLPAALAIAALGLAGCGADSDSAQKSPAGAAAKDQTGVTLVSDDWTLDATASASLLPGYMDAPLSFRMTTGWVNTAAAKEAGKEADPQVQRQQALASFGLFTLEAAAGKAEPGTYQLAPEPAGAESATVIIPLDKDAGLEGKYTSQSGTLTIKSVEMQESKYSSKVVAVDGSFDGVFADENGDTRPFSGNFRIAAK